MTENINRYLTELRHELMGSDRALIQDALSDAEEHLRAAIDVTREEQPDLSEAEALSSIVEKFGSPKEVAAGYREIEKYFRPALAQPHPVANRSALARFFHVYAEPRSWGALLYVMLCLVTGTLYFTWAVAGLSTSLGVMVLIIGIPFTVLFLLSVRGIAFVEGRLVEALLGVRMPRRSPFLRKGLGWWKQLKPLLFGKRTWRAMLYMVLQLPLGVIYFSVFTTLIVLAGALVATPVLGSVFGVPVCQVNGVDYYPSAWITPLFVIGGALLMTATMHLAKLVGHVHGALAKALLVSE